MKFDLWGPKGKWKIKKLKGVKNISAMNGEFPASITAEEIRGERRDISIELEYLGESIITPSGYTVQKGRPYSFSYTKFFQPINWFTAWFKLDTALYNPIRTNQLFANSVKTRPLMTEWVKKLDYAWWSGLKTTDSVYSQFMTLAEGSANFVKGNYELSVTWDDALKVYLDNKLILDEWNPTLHQFDESPNRRIKLPLEGKHSFRVEHLNLGGLGVLALKLKPVL